MQATYNPWIKPRKYKPSTDIEYANKRVCAKKTENRKRLSEHQESKRLKEECIDVLDEI